MRRQCVVRDCQFQGDLSGCKTSGTVSNKESKHLQANNGWLQDQGEAYWLVR